MCEGGEERWRDMWRGVAVEGCVKEGGSGGGMCEGGGSGGGMCEGGG